MIPILFSGSATNFETNGIGRLRDVVSCKVTEERNGAFELEMEIATTSPYFSDIKVGSLIAAQPFRNATRQAFEVYEISKPQNELCTVKAVHISYRASYIPIAPFVATGINNAISGLSANALENQPFEINTDITNTGSQFVIVSPKSLRACLGGSEGSLLDVFAGEYLWNNFEISLLQSRGGESGVYLRYGKNITELTHTESIEDTITGVLPYWHNSDGTAVVYGDIQYSPYVTNYPQHRTVCLDLSDKFQETPSATMLNQAGHDYITLLGLPNESIKLSYIELAQTGEEAVLEQVNLCDTVTVVYAPLGITFKSKVIKTVYDVLRERYESIEIGNPKSSLAKTLANAVNDVGGLIQSNQTLTMITQVIDRDLGIVSSDVREITDDFTDLVGTVNEHSTQLLQTPTNLDLSAVETRMTTRIDGTDAEVETLKTLVNITTAGLKLSQNNESNYVLITDSGMEIYVEGQEVAHATSEGFKATTFITGDWRIQPSNDGNTLNFYRRH